MLSYQTAYMKNYYPKEFYAAYMTQNIDDATKLSEAINTLKEKEIKLLPPDINESGKEFIPIKDGIRMPISAIKGIGGSVVYEINRLKPIKNLEDFLERRVKKFVKSNAVENLIKAGVFDEENKSRYDILFSFNPSAERKPNYAYEKEVFGFYIASSPFDSYPVTPFRDYNNGDILVTVAMPTEVSVRMDKRGNEMAFVTAVNNTDTLRMIIFSSVWKNNKCEEGELILIKGKKDNNSLLVNSIEKLEEENIINGQHQ